MIAKGFAPFASAEFAVAVRQAYEVTDVSLSVARANIEVTVRPTELIAAEQTRDSQLLQAKRAGQSRDAPADHDYFAYVAHSM